MKILITVSLLLSSTLFSESFFGYLKQSDASFCMSECSEYYLEGEDGNYINNFSLDSDNSDLLMYKDRFVEIDADEIVNCIECSALLIDSIKISSQCINPVSCFADPCLEVSSCESELTVEDCVSNYCGGCYADFYDSSGNLVDCQENSCMDLESLNFGLCEMIIGVGYINGSCNWISGCSEYIDGVDYSPYIFSSFSECEEACFQDSMTCSEIEEAYQQLHFGGFADCSFDSDCEIVWGDCGAGLGGCYYSVNGLYDEEGVGSLVDSWNNQGCMEWVCDCPPEPSAFCENGACAMGWCMEENPQGCFSSGCSEGFSCIDDYENSCIPSSCYCDELNGEWFCTEDCGGGICFLDGDVNLDAEVNVLDVVLVVAFILGTLESSSLDLSISDLNNDLSLDVLDIVILVSLVLGN